MPDESVLKDLLLEGAVFDLSADERALTKAAAGRRFGKERCVRQHRLPMPVFDYGEPRSEQPLLKPREAEGTAV